MIIYNVTVNIDKSINKEWLEWIREHIPQVLATGKFKEAKLTKVLVEDEETDTYSIQYRAHSRAALDSYYSEDAERLRKDGLHSSIISTWNYFNLSFYSRTRTLDWNKSLVLRYK